MGIATSRWISYQITGHQIIPFASKKTSHKRNAVLDLPEQLRVGTSGILWPCRAYDGLQEVVAKFSPAILRIHAAAERIAELAADGKPAVGTVLHPMARGERKQPFRFLTTADAQHFRIALSALRLAQGAKLDAAPPRRAR